MARNDNRVTLTDPTLALLEAYAEEFERKNKLKVTFSRLAESVLLVGLEQLTQQAQKEAS
jgi:hypothetical protein